MLSLKVCDKAVGSGHFLIAAAHRLAKRVAAARSGEEEPSPETTRTALRDVIGCCLYGVDINPMSAELCRVNLWLEALEPGKPLSFLDHHIRVGNSLLGTTPELIRGGIPEAAYDPIEGDDKAACTALKKQNKRENPKLGEMFIADEAVIRDKLFKAATAIDDIGDARPEDIHRKEAAFQAAQSNYDFQKAKDLADLWCAAFVIKKHFPGGASEISNLQSPVASLSVPTATQTGLFGGTEEAPKAKGRKPSTLNSQPSTLPWGITTQHLRDFAAGGELPDGLLAEAKRLADQFQFFHFHLAFPEVFAQGGFDVSLGNPPWERVNINQKEWFTSRDIEIAAAENAAGRANAISQLKLQNPVLWGQWRDALRFAGGHTHFYRDSGRFPLCGCGDINTYAVFAELACSTVSRRGRVGCILPSGLATDLTTQKFFNWLLDERSLVSFFEFENEGFFAAGRGHMLRFALTTISKDQTQTQQTKFMFKGMHLDELKDPARCFELTPEEILLINPNTRTCPIFTMRQDAEIVRRIYHHIPVFVLHGKEQIQGWHVELRRMIHLSDDAAMLRTKRQLEEEGWESVGNVFVRPGERMIPVIEAKMVYQYNHRHGDFRYVTNNERPHQLPEAPIHQLSKPTYATQPFYWVAESELNHRLATLWDRAWILGWRDVTDSRASARTVISAIIPRLAVTGYHQIFVREDPRLAAMLVANLSSFILDFVARQKVGSIHLTYSVLEQFPILPPTVFEQSSPWGVTNQTLRDWMLPRVLELTYTAWDLEAFAQDCGWSGPPFRWDEERRFLLRCELDAAFFHLYLGTEAEWSKQPEALTKAFPTPRHAVAYIMDTFPIVKRKDEARTAEKNAAGEVVKPGRYLTKDTILEIYDALQASIRTGTPYPTRLDPPPADPRCCHARRPGEERTQS